MSVKETSVATSLGARVHERRLELGLSLEQLGEQVGTDKGTLSRIERGLVSVDADRVVRLARALKVEAGELLQS